MFLLQFYSLIKNLWRKSSFDKILHLLLSKLEPIVDKWKSFGFEVSEVNGHDIKELKKNLELFVNKANSKPSVTICHTIKGKGFYFAENNPEWHYRRSFSKEEIKKLDECLR